MTGGPIIRAIKIVMNKMVTIIAIVLKNHILISFFEIGRNDAPGGC